MSVTVFLKDKNENPIMEEIPSSQTVDQRKKEKGGITGVFLTLALNALVTMGILYCYDQYFAQKVVSLDIKGYMEEQKKLYVGGKINDDQFKRNIERLEQVALKVPKQKVIIMGDAVVRNAEIINAR